MSDRFSLDGRVASSPVAARGSVVGRHSFLPNMALTSCLPAVGSTRWSPRPRKSTSSAAGHWQFRPMSAAPDACRQLVDTTLAEFGRVDVLVNCAGGAETQSIFKWSDEDFEKVLTLNFKAVWHLSRAVARPMIEQGKGAIVNISSGASLLAMPQAAPYGAAKAAMNNLTASMAAAWAKKGIRVNAVAVGAVRAATLTDDAARYGLDPEAIAMTNGLGRLGEPDEIGYGVLFFASDASSFCSGQTLYMHGAPGSAGV